MVGSIITGYSRSPCSIIIIKDTTSEKQDPELGFSHWLHALIIYEEGLCTFDIMKVCQGWSGLDSILKDGGGRRKKAIKTKNLTPIFNNINNLQF